MTQIPHICSISILRKSLRLKDRRSGKLCHLYICVLLMSNSWDTETNPGPDSRSDSHFPCGLCDVSVGLEDLGICCDTCNVWYHIDCQALSPTMYSIYTTQSLIRAKLLILFAGGPAYLIRKIIRYICSTTITLQTR